MRVVLVHNQYRSGTPGGEDVVFREEKALLESAGIEVQTYTRSNDEMRPKSLVDRARVLAGLRRSRRTRRDLNALLDQFKPDIVHCHNTFPLISVSAYESCHSRRIPVVQTVHNYRLVCASGNHYRANSICEDCTPGRAWSAVRHACYMNSRAASLAVAGMITVNHRSRVYLELVDRFIALNRFSANRLVAMGIPVEKLIIKPNFVGASFPRLNESRQNYFLFAGRLSTEKGLEWLISAWHQLQDIPLVIAGDGPLRDRLEQQVKMHGLPIRFLGMQSREAVRSLMVRSRGVVFPSLWFEGMPMTILEAWQSEAPVICSSVGGLPELIRDGVDGLLVKPGDHAGLALAVRRIATDSSFGSTVAASALERVQAEFSPQRNLELLLDIYRITIAGYAPQRSP
jgi:glycosyltransferase involved in cell wall biosynthesis